MGKILTQDTTNLERILTDFQMRTEFHIQSTLRNVAKNARDSYKRELDKLSASKLSGSSASTS
jgi:hypothetical protein